MSAFDLVIIGGGVIGGSIAFELAAEKLNILLVDRQQPGCEASWAAAGMLSPSPDSAYAAPLVPLAKESLRLYPRFVKSIEETSGRSTAYTSEGTLEIFSAPQGVPERDRMIAEHRRLGLAAEEISLEAARKLEESLGPAARAAAWLPEEATVDPRLLIDALLAAVRLRGVEIRTNCQVTFLLREGDRCSGVVAGNETIAAKNVVVAAGCFSSRLAADNKWFARYAPTHPVRGQMLSLRPKSLKLQRVLRSEKGYLVPRRDGRIVAGSTLENAGYDKHVTPAGMRQILDAALELVPGLAGAEIVETWAGLRPGTPDGLPLLGPTDIRGLLIATGHYRNGILLAPVTAKLVRNWILGDTVTSDTEIFSPLRFEEGTPHSGALKSSRAIP
jgi:glycine oxidase